MTELVNFPPFKPIGLEDRDTIRERLWKYQPETSELTFTNLFIWRDHYGISWAADADWLLIVFNHPELHALPPIGAAPRRDITRQLLLWLREQGADDPRIARADARLVSELAGDSDFIIEPVREHYDYLYRCQDLIELAGRKYHAKRNFLNSFRRNYQFVYEELTPALVPACLDLGEAWCRLRHCEEDMGLAGEAVAVREALTNLAALELKGGLIRIEGRVEAFSLGELLNQQMAVIHIEKANPDIRGLYAVINQQFCEHAWQEVPFINREQDLGEASLRETKLSYQPERLVEKYNIRLKTEAIK